MKRLLAALVVAALGSVALAQEIDREAVATGEVTNEYGYRMKKSISVAMFVAALGTGALAQEIDREAVATAEVPQFLADWTKTFGRKQNEKR